MAKKGSKGGNKKMATKSDNALLSALSYPIPIVGLFVFLTQKEDLTAKFHGLQAVLYWVLSWVVVMVLGLVFGALSFLGALMWLAVVPLLWLAMWVYSLYVGYKAYKGEKVLMPVVGTLAEKHAS